MLTRLVRILLFCLRSFRRSKGANTASSSSVLMASSLSSLLQLYSLMYTLSPLSALPVDDVRPLSWIGFGGCCSPDAAAGIAATEQHLAAFNLKLCSLLAYC